MPENFRFPRNNLIESSEGFSVEVLGRTGLLYRQGERSMEVDSEVLAPGAPAGLAIWSRSIQHWRPPYDQDLIDEQLRTTIVDNIRRAVRSKGEGIEVVDDPKLQREILRGEAEQAIRALFEAGDQALMSADAESLGRIFADDYVQYDAAGKAWTKAEILANFQTGAIRYPSIVSTGRTIRLFGDWAIVHGSESDEVESGGERRAVTYLYMDVAVKRNGQWRIVASQLVTPAERQG